MRSAFTDLAYTLLLGLDGEAQIGGIQHTYQLLDEEGNKLAGEGEIGSFAWEYFHGKDHSDWPAAANTRFSASRDVLARPLKK